MSYPRTAALDPIFWLHHANIDRLWEVWRRNPPAHMDPTDPNWINGPGNIGERVFAAPRPDGTAWIYTPGEMSDLENRGYNYDDLSPAGAAPAPIERLARLGMRATARNAVEGGALVQTPKNVEMVGAS